jgi:hypothetical protein
MKKSDINRALDYLLKPINIKKDFEQLSVIKRMEMRIELLKVISKNVDVPKEHKPDKKGTEKAIDKLFNQV